MTAKGTEARVCQDIAARQQKGVSKYGTTVAENPLGMVQWLQHAYEEALDQAIYLKRAIEQLQGVPAEVKANEHLNLPVVEPKWVQEAVIGTHRPVSIIALTEEQRTNMRAHGWSV